MSVIETIVVVVLATALGIVTGNGSVYVFNHLPDRWLETEEAGREYQRVKSVPWKYVLSATFVVIGIYLGFSDPIKAVGIYVAFLILVQIIISALLYGTLPGPLCRMLALTALGILPFGGDLKLYVLGMIAGIMAGGGFMLVKGLASKKAFSWKILELTAAIGLLMGWKKAIIIIVIGFTFWALAAGLNSFKMKKVKPIYEGFFVSLVAAMWMVIDNGVAKRIIDGFLW